MPGRVILFNLFFLSAFIYAQKLEWHSLNGPMGGIIGGMDINSNGEIFTGVYPFTINYTGIYKSSDNGNNWIKIETQFEDFNVYTIYITKEDQIWVGTEGQGLLYCSTDDGNTWENKAAGYQSSECWAIGESNDGVLFAGNADGGPLYRSTNNGDTWDYSSGIGPLAFASDTNNTIFAGTFSGLYFTTDKGINWLPINNFSNIAVSSIVVDSNNNIFCGTGYYDNGNGVYYSDDGGQSWTQMGLAGKVVLSLALDSQENLYAGTLKDGLFKTTDSGQNWYQYTKGIYKKEIYRLKINEQDDIFAGSEGGGEGWYFYGGGGIFRSTNGGESFDQVGLPISLVKNIVFSGDSLIIASTPSGLQQYNRFTKKWKNLGLHNVEAITITPSDYLYAATREDGLYKSTDFGKNWQLTNLTADTLMPVYNVLTVNDDTLFAATFYNLRRSFDGGDNWDILSVKTDGSSRALFLNNNNIWSIGFDQALDNYILYKSNNLGNSFIATYSGFGSQNDANNTIAATNNDYVYLAIRSNSLSGILRSNDNGSSWMQVLDTRVATVFADNSGLVITGSLISSLSDSNKVYISNDYGSTWLDFNQPTKRGIYITDIKQDPTNRLFFGTSGEGLYDIEIITGVEEQSAQIILFNLSQNFPNPFNSNTVISYRLPVTSFATLIVYDMLGHEITTLVNEEKMPGLYEVEFDASGLASGVYLYRLKAGELIQTKKMILLK